MLLTTRHMTVSSQWQKQELSSGEPQPLFDAASFDVIPGDCKGAKHASYLVMLVI